MIKKNKETKKRNRTQMRIPMIFHKIKYKNKIQKVRSKKVNLKVNNQINKIKNLKEARMKKAKFKINPNKMSKIK